MSASAARSVRRWHGPERSGTTGSILFRFGLITRRSRVRIPPPLLTEALQIPGNDKSPRVRGSCHYGRVSNVCQTRRRSQRAYPQGGGTVAWMAVQKAIVCLANSRKYNAYCVAGVEQDSREWIRPLGTGAHGAVTLAEQTLDDGSQPELLDVIEVALRAPTPDPAQPENWDLASGRWVLRDHLDDAAARELLEDLAVETPVFGTNERSISVEKAHTDGIDSSLAVIRAEHLSWTKRVWPEGTKIRARFTHAGARHDLPVTDLAWCSEFVGDEEGEYDHVDTEQVFLVISLGEPYNDEHWKLVAGVVALQR